MDNSTDQNSNDFVNPTPQSSGSVSMSTVAISSTPVNPPMKTKKRKRFDWLIPVAIALGVFCVVIGIVIWKPVLEELPQALENAMMEYNGEIQVGNLSAKYSNIIWPNRKNGSLNSDFDSEAVKLEGEYGVVTLAYMDTSPYYYSAYQVASSLKSEYESVGFTATQQSPTKINGISWEIVTASNNNERRQVYVFSDAYETYTVVVEGNSSNFSETLQYVQEIMLTIRIENPDSANSQKNAKRALIGEWDWGNHGYAIITSDYIYIYQDASKNEDNVYSGTYEAEDKVPTYVAGYIDGYNLIITIDSCWRDGEYISDIIGKQLQYVFVPNSDGSYNVKNMLSGSTFEARKVK